MALHTRTLITDMADIPAYLHTRRDLERFKIRVQYRIRGIETMHRRMLPMGADASEGYMDVVETVIRLWDRIKYNLDDRHSQHRTSGDYAYEALVWMCRYLRSWLRRILVTHPYLHHRDQQIVREMVQSIEVDLRNFESILRSIRRNQHTAA